MYIYLSCEKQMSCQLYFIVWLHLFFSVWSHVFWSKLQDLSAYSPTVLEFKNRLELKSPNFHHIIPSNVIELWGSNFACAHNDSIWSNLQISIDISRLSDSFLKTWLEFKSWLEFKNGWWIRSQTWYAWVAAPAFGPTQYWYSDSLVCYILVNLMAKCVQSVLLSLH